MSPPIPPSPVQILGISGSLREGSVSRQMVDKVLEQCSQVPGIQTDVIDLRQHTTLPFCDGGLNNNERYGPEVQALREKIRQADAYVIGTPEFHGGPSGALKNLIDLQCMKAFSDKWIALVGAAGGQFGADGALNQIRVWLKNLDAHCLPMQASARGMDCDPTQGITNQKLLDRLEAMGNKLASITLNWKQNAP